MSSAVNKELIASLYKKMRLIRDVEQHIVDVYHTDAVKSPVHLSIGQEAVAAAICESLAKDDLISNTYRCHATHIAKGGDLSKMIAELYGKKDGCAGGKAGSMHLVDMEHGIIGASAVVGTTIPIAAGFALALKKEAAKTGKQRVIIAVFGDGATEEGCFIETINFAALHQLPIIFVCENNLLAIHSLQKNRWATDQLCERVATYGIPTKKIEDGDIFAMHDAVKEAIENIRASKQGPFFLEFKTYRWLEHVGPRDDHNLNYRDKEAFAYWQKHDQIARLAEMLDKETLDRINTEVAQEIATAVKFAEDSPYPGEEEFLKNVYAKDDAKPQDNPGEQKLIRYATAIRDALDCELGRDDKVFLFGLDVDDHVGIQGSTVGLPEKHGKDRVFGTPLSEDAMTGVAIGAAMAGYRPVHVHIRMDFMLLVMNQLVNMGAKSHYMYNGQVKVPLVVRTMIGRSWGQGGQHSQALHSMFMHVPGLKVVAPSNAHDAKGCLIAAIRDNNPVVFIEHRLLYNMEGYVPEGSYTVELGKARVMTEGSDITIVAVSHMVIVALRAQKLLECAGIKAEVIDPVTLKPLDIDGIASSVKKTGRLLIVDNAWLMCGLGSEIMAEMHEKHPEGINGKPLNMARMGFAETTCPTTRCLEDLFYPNAKTIALKAYEMVTGKSDSVWLPTETEKTEVDAFKGPF